MSVHGTPGSLPVPHVPRQALNHAWERSSGALPRGERAAGAGAGWGLQKVLPRLGVRPGAASQSAPRHALPTAGTAPPKRALRRGVPPEIVRKAGEETCFCDT